MCTILFWLLTEARGSGYSLEPHRFLKFIPTEHTWSIYMKSDQLNGLITKNLIRNTGLITVMFDFHHNKFF